MSGKKQHYIPQSFQRPFRIKDNKKSEIVWVYRKGQKTPYPDPIKNVAAEGFFYSDLPRTDEKTLDDTITEYENRLDKLLKQLRDISTTDAMPTDIVGEVISHLTSRSKSLRSFMKDSFTGLVEKLSLLLDGDFDIESFPAGPLSPGLEATLVEAITKHSEASKLELKDGTLARIAYAYARENADDILDNARDGIGIVVSLVKVIDWREAHAGPLQDMFSRKGAKKYSKLDWSIHPASEGMVVLPDCIGIASKDGVDFEPLIGASNEAKVIIVPLTPEKVLIATAIHEFRFSVANFNTAAARCSSELFIASEKTEYLCDLQESIGIVPESLHTGAVDQAINSLSTRLVSPPINMEGDQSEIATSYDLKLFLPNGIAELHTNEEITQIAKDIASCFSQRGLERLSSIHFDDHKSVCAEYAADFLPVELRDGSQRVRSDGVCAVLPSRGNSSKHELHINHTVLELFLNTDENEIAVDYIKSADADLLLVPIFERFDAGGFSNLEQHFIVHAIRALRNHNRNLQAKVDLSDLQNLVDETISQLTETWNKESIKHIQTRHKDQPGDAVHELLERMAYTLVVLSVFAARSQQNLEMAAAKVCDSTEFLKWISLFEKDMGYAIRLLKQDQIEVDRFF